MGKRYLNCTASDILKMDSAQLIDAIAGSEGRLLVCETIGAVRPMLGDVTNAEFACAMGADLLILNLFDVNKPEVQGLPETAPEDVIRERTENLLERVGMTDAADKKTGTYSRGMKQRLGIADVLIKDPEVIIMDEPTLGIDPQGMRDLLRLIRELSEKDGRTILISSHQLYQIQQICDRVGIFVDGRLIACGTIEELGRQMESEGKYTLELAAEPDNDALVQLMSRMEGVDSVEREGELLIVRSREDLRRKATLALAANGYTLLQLRQKGGDLDEIYSRYFEKAEKEQQSRTALGTRFPKLGRGFRKE